MDMAHGLSAAKAMKETISMISVMDKVYINGVLRVIIRDNF